MSKKGDPPFHNFLSNVPHKPFVTEGVASISV